MSASECPVSVTLQPAVEASADLPAEALFGEWVNVAIVAAEAAVPADACVTIRVVSRDESAGLNNSFRQVDKPTNVLAFPAGDSVLPPELGEEPELGDLVICHDVVLGEADEQAKPVRAHYAHLTVHGCLHLLGYDHVDAKEAIEMEALETRIVMGLGFADPYA